MAHRERRRRRVEAARSGLPELARRGSAKSSGVPGRDCLAAGTTIIIIITTRLAIEIGKDTAITTMGTRRISRSRTLPKSKKVVWTRTRREQLETRLALLLNEVRVVKMAETRRKPRNSRRPDSLSSGCRNSNFTSISEAWVAKCEGHVRSFLHLTNCRASLRPTEQQVTIVGGGSIARDSLGLCPAHKVVCVVPFANISRLAGYRPGYRKSRSCSIGNVYVAE